MSKQDLTYNDAYLELQQILNDIESDLSIDALTDKLKRAKTLLQFCKEKLRTVEEEVQSLIEE